MQIEILFCGICHSDLHQARNEWSGVMPTVYPCVPGHEIVGRVTKVGPAVTKFKPGDLAGVGCLVDSDGTCPECKAGFEQFCPNLALTYNFPDKHSGGVTYGGYSDSIVVTERFVLQRSFEPRSCRDRTAAVRGNHDLLADAALGRDQGQEGGRRRARRVGPHGGEVRARSWGAHRGVYNVCQARRTTQSASGRMRLSFRRNADEMAKHAGSFDFILDAVAAEHDINAYIGMLRRDGNLTMVGAPEKPLAVNVFGLIFARRSFSGSLIGGIAETQEMLDFCGKHNITSDVEVIPIQKLNEAYERLVKSDVKYRFSIDMASLKSE